MAGRPQAHASHWKEHENKAETTVFVHPDLVERRDPSSGLKIVRALTGPFHRAVAMMFVSVRCIRFETATAVSLAPS